MDNPQRNQQPPPSGQVTLRIPASRPYATYALLGIIALVFLAQMITNQMAPTIYDQPLLDFGAIDFQRILINHEYYRLFTAMFLHAGPAQVFFNGLSLYIFGQIVERIFGHRRFLAIYFLGGLSGSIASFIFTQGNTVGASAAIFAVFGAEMVFLYQNRHWLGQAAIRELRSLVLLAALNLGVGLFTQVVPGGVSIDNWAHIGGLIGGMILAWFIGPQFQLRQDIRTPSGYRLEDNNPVTKTWLPPLIFAGALLLVMAYALINLRA